jgi:hypothetical protein
MTSSEEKEKKNYKGKDPMSPEKITSHEPTAVKRDSDTEIAEGGKTGTDTEEALEEYRRQGMTKVSENNTTTTGTSVGQQQYQEGSVEDETSEAANTVKEGAESTFDKIKAGAKALGKKVTDPDTSIEEEYNKEKSQ